MYKLCSKSLHIKKSSVTLLHVTHGKGLITAIAGTTDHSENLKSA
jgi:hypothetical protein